MSLKLSNEGGTAVEVERQTRVGAIHVQPTAIEFPQLKYKVDLAEVVDDPKLAVAFATVFMAIDTNQQLKALARSIEKLAEAIARPAALGAPRVTMPTPEQMAAQVSAVLPLLTQALRAAGLPIPDLPSSTSEEKGG